MMNTQFRGSLVALVTPMLSDGRIDTRAYERLLAYHLEQGTDGLVIGGTTGESPTLTASELEDLVRTAKRRVNGKIPVIAGSGTNNTAASVTLTQRASAAGADACLLVTPYYNKPTQRGLLEHYQAVAEATTVPLILYNVPGRTGCDLLPATVEQLSVHPRICAIKEATASVERATEIKRRCGDQIDIISGDDGSALELMRAGAIGVISVSANLVPAAMARMCALARDNEWEQAAKIEQKLRDLHQVLFIESNPIPVKYGLWRLGLIEPGLRLPMTALSVEHQAEVVSAMTNAGLEVLD